MKGVESTRLPQPSPSTTSRSTFSAAPARSSTSRTTNNTPAIVGGVVGGLVALGLIAALIIFLVLRSKQKTQKYNSSFQLTNPSVIHSMSPPPGSPGRIYVSGIRLNIQINWHDTLQNPDNRSLDPTINDPNRPLVASDITGSSAQNHTHQGITKNSNYSGMPELWIPINVILLRFLPDF